MDVHGEGAQMSHGRYAAASEAVDENAVIGKLVSDLWPTHAAKFFFVSSDPQPFHFSSTGFPHLRVCGRYTRCLPEWPCRGGLTVSGWTTTLALMLRVVACLLLIVPSIATAQTVSPLYRVFLSDGSSLSSYGEWARVDDRVVFSMPVMPGDDPAQLHLVSIAAERVDWHRTEQYADTVRAARYGASRGEEDFARLSAEVAHVLNEIALVNDPAERLTKAERARRALADWPSRHYGYRAKEVHEILGTLDEVIGELRAAAGLGRFELALMANTPPPPAEPILAPPDQTEVVQQLMSAAALVDSPEERVSLFQTVIGVLDRAVGLLPENWASTIRSSALGAIAEERKTDAAYRRLRETILASAARYGSRADVRGLEKLRAGLQAQDEQLGRRRTGEMTAITAAIDAHLDAAQRLRLAQDQWILRVDRMRTYQRSTTASVSALTRVRTRLEDIRALAGPAPWRLRPLINLLGRESRTLSRIDPPAELSGVHALFRSASEMALNAAELRLHAVEAADLDLARRASSAAAGAIMLLSRAKAELDAALRPPVAPAAAQ